MMKLRSSNVARIGFISVVISVILIITSLKVIHEHPKYSHLSNKRIISSNYKVNEAKIEKEKTNAENTEGYNTKGENIKLPDLKGENTKIITYIKVEAKGDNGKGGNNEGDNIKTDIQKLTITTNLSAVDRLIFKSCVPNLQEEDYTEGRTCSPNMMFRPPNRSNPMTALISFPGSGNTWLRRIIEETTGVYTGAIYCDKGLKKKGFYGEMLTSNSVIAVKTHASNNRRIDGKGRKEFDSVIFLIRNPYDAILAEANRDWGHGHTGVADMDNFRNSVRWKSYVAGMAMRWETTARTWLQDDKPLLIVRYEDLESDIVNEMKRLLNFLKVPYTEETLDCVLNSDLNTFKRNHGDEDIYNKYYSNDYVKQSVNYSIQNIRGLLQKHTITY